jgi:hypothetical protein
LWASAVPLPIGVVRAIATMAAVIANFRVMERSFIHVRHPISASDGWHMWRRPTGLPCKN